MTEAEQEEAFLKTEIAIRAKQNAPIEIDRVSQMYRNDMAGLKVELAKAAMFDEFVESLTDIRIELAALLPFPSTPMASDWPCKNSADQLCLQKSYEIVTEQLARARELQLVRK